MRYVRRKLSDELKYARIEGGLAVPYDRAPWDGGKPCGPAEPWTEAELVCPVTPSKIVCIGRNYVAHAKELGDEVPKEPLFFLKAPSSLLDPGGMIELPPESARVEHEAELGLIIGTRCKRVPRERAHEVIFGYTVVGDITARDLQRTDGQWTRAKSFDTFCPVGPWIETELDPARVAIQCAVNGVVRQDGHTRDMVFDVPTLVAYVSAMMTLEPGDLIATGTPEGIGPLAPGDELVITVTGEGKAPMALRTRVVRAA